MSRFDTYLIRRFNPNLMRGGKLVFIFGVLCLVLFLLFVFNPAEGSFYPPCLFHKLTGFHCPGCGSLRAVYQLLHGNLPAAFGLNPLMVLSLPFLGYWFISRYVLVGRNQRSVGRIIPVFWIWVIFLIIILYWILRNLPFCPFTLLAP